MVIILFEVFTFPNVREQTGFKVQEFNGLFMTDECEENWSVICANQKDDYPSTAEKNVFDCCSKLGDTVWRFTLIFKYLCNFSLFTFINLLGARIAYAYLRFKGKLKFVESF